MSFYRDRRGIDSGAASGYSDISSIDEMKKADPDCLPSDHRSRRLKLPIKADGLESAARLFRAMGDPGRLELLALLAQGEACVTELAAGQDDGMSTISQRLRVLHTEKLIRRRREGKHIFYALADQHVLEMVFNALAHAGEAKAGA
jgi:ArsR family transcriptional regulator, lead/cadmium/zinc/bismuth-responsive transcriptional repressor